jgi:hypothetical protein
MNNRLIVAPERERAVYDLERLFGVAVYMDRDPTDCRFEPGCAANTSSSAALPMA